MEAARPSRTALRVAMRRAAHQLYDAHPLVFEDPVAVPILGREYLPEVERTVNKLNKPFSVALRAFMVVRSRYAEDLLAQAIARGLTQYVVLGAGLDTFAYRNPYPNLRVFEIDHPATQRWKREMLAANGITAPENLTFTPVDFEHQQLATQLIEAGLDTSAPTFFSWLGVVPYLTQDAFRSTISFIASLTSGGGVVMDYAQPRSVLAPHEQLALDSLSSRVQLAGEPFQLFFKTSQMAEELKAFHSIEDLGTPELNARYFSRRTDNLKLLGGAGRIVSAWL
ncbi:MAG TPA: class I SAM-dependent methyltransferase [Edaphobacter sp.]|jgi:methyltransferase (TIGR00027 family)|nr:class I SAM-dependent methyltransferase [Edaphobacter sp.]